MPAFSPVSLMSSLVNHTTLTKISLSSSIATNHSTNLTANITGNDFQVLCAWPVSGQYGPGSRILYYVLVAACVVGRKAEWLRNACLAAALLFPAVAALHGIVLAAVHVNDAVDMDIYGAFQLCSIGILAAPVTVRLSRTFFFETGRNMIFLWTGLILAGLLSLMVEFYRSTPIDCNGSSASSNVGQFLGNQNPICGFNCSVGNGPTSPLRGGSTNNIYIIPAPDKLTFNTATLFAAACCIPAILSLISMCFKILEINWKSRFGRDEYDENADGSSEELDGANTVEKGVENMIRLWLRALEIPVYAAAILAILILGEMNFFSAQVRFQTEPISSIGQWAPIVGTGLAALGSLYLLLAADMEAYANHNAPIQHCNCSHHHPDGERHSSSETHRRNDYSPSIRDGVSMQIDDRSENQMRQVSRTFTPSIHSLATPDDVNASLERGNTLRTVPTSSRRTLSDGEETDVGNRRKVARTLTKLGVALSAAAHEHLDNAEFDKGKARDFPEIPGEIHRNVDLPQIRAAYNHSRDGERDLTSDQPSRAPSFIGSIASGVEGSSRATSPYLQQSSNPSSSLSNAMLPRRMVHSNTLPTGMSPQRPAAPVSASDSQVRPRARADTLQVPSPAHHSFSRSD